MNYLIMMVLSLHSLLFVLCFLCCTLCFNVIISKFYCLSLSHSSTSRFQLSFFYSLTLKYPRSSFYGGIRSGSIDSLASLTNLKHLQLYDDKFYGNLHSLNKLKRLEVLKLRGTKIEADGLHLPSLFPRLKILKLTDNPKLMGTFILSQTLKSVIFNNQNDITVDELSLMNLAKDCEIDLPLRSR
jgi:hypothetical protein